MTLLLFFLDLSVIAAALASAWLWAVAGRNRVRRISKREVLDAADINRIVVALNRSQILNTRAALATALAAGLAAARLAVEGGLALLR